jgi:hypothetical protein
MNAVQPFDPELGALAHSGFTHPRDVAESRAVIPEEKRCILLQWLEDEKALLVADDEGMQGDRPSQMDQVHQALRELQMSAVDAMTRRNPGA